MRNFLASFSAFAFMLSSCGQLQKADHIYINAKIWTGDSSNPWADAIAIKGNTIVYVGKDYQPYGGNHTLISNMQGKMIVPGFIDTHTHFLAGGYQLASVNLRSVKSKRELIDSLKDFTGRIPKDRWILGGDWDHEAWGGELPSKDWIDSVSGRHPVFINRYDGHMALANSISLALAGISKSTPDPPGGQILRNPKTGEPTGILRDQAMDLVQKCIPDFSESELDEFLQRAISHALSFGVTEVHDMGSYGGWDDLSTYRRAYAKQRLGIRIYSFVPIQTWAKLDSLVKKNGRGDDQLHWGGLKGFVDGSLGSTTAWFYRPYLDAPRSTGLQVTDTHHLRKWIIQADSAGLQLATHAIGDRANDWILGIYAEAALKNGTRDRRSRVEHAQHLTTEAIPRFVALGVIPSMQPYHAIDDGKWAAKRLDEDRLKRTYAFRSLLDSKARLSFGTDWTVAPINPLEGIYAAVTRRTLDDKYPGGWYPEQKISVEEALRCYTANSAYAGFQENALGRLKAGMLADFAVLSENLFTIVPEKIREVKVLLTVVNGRELYERFPH